MNFLIKIFCFLSFLNCVITKFEVGFEFSAVPLGHSGLLIYWGPQSLSSKEYVFSFSIYIVGEKNDESSGSSNGQYHSYIDKIEACSKSSIYDTCATINCNGSFKIHSLNESTMYNIQVMQYAPPHSLHVMTYHVGGRTHLKSAKVPAKPYFEFIRIDPMSTFGVIKWYPCGKERICRGQESGTHFGIKIKETHSRSEVKKEESYADQRSIFFLPGRIYEAVVYSVNGESKTDSDPQEISFKPGFSAVQCVNVISLPDLSVLINWKPPKESGEKYSVSEYLIFNLSSSNPDEDRGNPFFYFKDLSEFNNHFLRPKTVYEGMRFFSLKPEVVHTFIIIPAGSGKLGFEYEINHKHQGYNHNLSIAQPDFNYELLRKPTECQFYFQWLPCGHLFNCYNTKPGSEYSFQFKPEPQEKYQEKDTGYYRGIFALDQVYNVTVESSIGSNFSEAVTKKFQNCNEIREGTSLDRGN